MDWLQLLRNPASGDHVVQTWQDQSFLAETVGEYIGAGLWAGDAVMVVATPEHRALFRRRLAYGAGQPGQFRLLDVDETLRSFMQGGMPDWTSFQRVVGGQIAELRLQFPSVRIYGEAVDVLWQRGEREAALRLEEFWNELATLQTFSLFCSYRLDALDGEQYDVLECLCRAHTHLVPARDPQRLDEAVAAASEAALDQPLAQMLQSLSASQRPATEMPPGQATLMWLHKNMPRAADKVLRGVRQRLGA